MNYKIIISFIFLFVARLAIAANFLPPTSTVVGNGYLVNKGQFPDSVLARTDISNGYFYITQNGFEILQQDNQAIHELRHGHSTDSLIKMFHIKTIFKGANSSPKAVYSKDIPTKTSFFSGNNPTKWQSDVPTVSTILVENIYENIDIKYSQSVNNNIKYDWILKPNANPDEIEIEYRGAENLCIRNNKLSYKTSFTAVTEFEPKAFQYIEGKKKEVLCKYMLQNRKVKFEFPNGYNANYELVIDPEIEFASYTGSVADNWGFTATYDSIGNMYVGGIITTIENEQNSFPTHIGAFQRVFNGGQTDIAIFKFSADGKQRLGATYLGGSSYEHPMSLIVNHKNELIILGVSASMNFPVSANTTLSGFTDLVVLKMKADLSTIISSRYFGGSFYDGLDLMTASYYNPTGGTNLGGSPVILNSNYFLNGNLDDIYFYGDEYKSEVKVDKNDNVYIATSTRSSNITCINCLTSFLGGNQDGLLLKLSANLDTVKLSTYIGGNGNDSMHSVEIDTAGYIFVCGTTRNSTFDPLIYANPQNAKLDNTDGYLIKLGKDFSTILGHRFIGSIGWDKAVLIELDQAQNIYVMGNTWGNFPVSSTYGTLYSNSNSGQYIQKLTNDLSSVLLSSRFGASRNEPDMSVTAFTVDSCNQILMAGWLLTGTIFDGLVVPAKSSRIINLPTTPDAYKQSLGVAGGFYFAVFENNFTRLRYATMFGGGGEEHVDGGTSRFDKKGIIYQAICASCQGDVTNKLSTPGVWATENGSSNCNMLGVKFNLKYTPVKVKIQTNPPLSRNGTITGLVPFKVSFLNKSTVFTDKTSFEWEFPDGSKFTYNTPTDFTATFDSIGMYNVKLVAKDSSFCKSRDEINAFIYVNPFVDSTIYCKGFSSTFNVTGGSKFNWNPKPFLDNPFSKNPTAFADTTTIYTVTVSNAALTYNIPLTTTGKVFPKYQIDYTTEITPFFNQTEVVISSQTQDLKTYNVLINNGLSSSVSFSNFTFKEEGLYTYTINGFDKNNCPYQSVDNFEVKLLSIPNVITPNGDDKNENFVIKGLQENQVVKIEIFDRWGTQVYQSEAYKNDWNAPGQPDGVYYFTISLSYQFKSTDLLKGWIQVLR